MRKVLILARSSILDGVRWARQHIYAWLVLAPIVLGLTYLSASRLAESVASYTISTVYLLVLASSAWLLFIALGLTRTSSEIYHTRQPESHFDALPVQSSVFLHTTLLRVIVRFTVAAIVLMVLRTLIVPETPLLPIFALAPMVTLIALTAACRLFAALNWIHWGHTRQTLAAIGAILVVFASTLSAGGLILSLFITSFHFPARLTMVFGAAAALVTYLFTLAQHRRWRLADIEYARRLPAGGIGLESLPRWMGRMRKGPGGAQLARDLRLTIRGFSSAVHVVAALGVLLPLTLVVLMENVLLVAPRGSTRLLDMTWLPQVMAIKAACVLEICTFAGLVPVLISYELPHLWLERAVGATGLDVWDAKLAYTRLVTLPGCLLVCVAGIATFATPASYIVPLVAECLWLWWMISSLAGALAFEMPTRPGLSLVLVTTVGLGIGSITAFAWPAGLLTYAQAMHGLKERGRQRARYYLLTETE